MEVLIALLGLAFLVWIVIRAQHGSKTPTVSSAQATHVNTVVDMIVDVFRAGAVFGYDHSWQHQVDAEVHRVAIFLRLLRRRILVHTLVAASFAGIFGYVALGLGPGIPAWLPSVGSSEWWWIAGVTSLAYYLVAMLIGLPRYAKVHGSLEPQSLDLLTLRSDVLRGSSHASIAALTVARQSITDANVMQFKGGFEAGRAEGHAAGFTAGMREGERRGWEKGNEAGKRETARIEEQHRAQLVSEAYARGRTEGEASGASNRDADVEAARQAGAREGFGTGYKQGRAKAQQEAAQRFEQDASYVSGMLHGKPRTRAEALLILELEDGADPERIREQYRNLIRLSHPDIYAKSRYPKAFRKFAEHEFKRLGEARDLLEKAGHV